MQTIKWSITCRSYFCCNLTAIRSNPTVSIEGETQGVFWGLFFERWIYKNTYIHKILYHITFKALLSPHNTLFCIRGLSVSFEARSCPSHELWEVFSSASQNTPTGAKEAFRAGTEHILALRGWFLHARKQTILGKLSP